MHTANSVQAQWLVYDAHAADLLFQIVSRRDEQHSIVVTTNLPFKQWDTIFPDASCAVASRTTRKSFRTKATAIAAATPRSRTNRGDHPRRPGRPSRTGGFPAAARSRLGSGASGVRRNGFSAERTERDPYRRRATAGRRVPGASLSAARATRSRSRTSRNVAQPPL